MSADISIAPAASLRLPETIEEPGILVGWSMEPEHTRRAIGFNFGDPEKSPSTGYVDPIQLAHEGHLITIAPTGTGKGIGCIVPALLRHDGPIIVIDPKGENVAITARRRRELGQQVVVLDPMGITDFDSGALNPLDIIDIESPTAGDDASAIVAGLWAGAIDSRDRFWVSRAQHFVAGLILYLLSDCPPSQRNLASIRDLTGETISNPESMIERLRSSTYPEVRRIVSTVLIPARETVGGIMAFAQELTDFLRGPLIQKAIGKSSFSLDDITRGDPLSVYLVLPPHMLESHGRLLRLWVSTLITAITRRRTQPPRPTLFLLDEAAQLGTLSQLRQALTLLRGYGLQTWSFWQDVSQIRELYPRDWTTMVNNCRVLQCFGALNMNAAEDMAQLTGIGSGERVLDLAEHEMVLQLAGDEAVIARRPNYLTDPLFAGAYDPNPYYQPSREIMPPPHPFGRYYQRPKKGGAAERRHGGTPLGANLGLPDDLLLNRLRELWPDEKRS